MERNVGLFDRFFRAAIALLLLWVGIYKLDGQDGNYLGVLVAMSSLLPIYVSTMGTCFVLKWLGIHTMTKQECHNIGRPFRRRKKVV